MKRSDLYKLLAVPAVAGLLIGVGCDDGDDVADTYDDSTMTTPREPGTPGGTPDATTPPTDTGRTAGAEMGGQMDQQIEQVTTRIENLRTRAEQNTEAAGLSDRLETLQEAVENREWPRVVTTVTETRSMTMPEDLKTEFEAIVTQLRQMDVPELRNLPDSDFPTAPGIPPPDETGGAAGDTGGSPDGA